MSDDGAWFAPKRVGYGAGLPISWQGWALTIGYTAGVIAVAATLIPRHPLIAVPIIVAATVAMIAISAQHTRGGWKWRWGKDD